MEQNSAQAYVAALVERARKAQSQIEFADQKTIDDLCARIAWSGAREDFARKIAEFAVEETGMGRVDSKFGKMRTKVRGAYRDTVGKKTVGAVEKDEVNGIMKLAKPVGVIGALAPVTNCEATPFCKAIHAVKTRNAIILAPHPRAKGTNKMAVEQIRSVLAKQGMPEDLVIAVEEVSVEISGELLKQSDLILATGGPGMVQAAYSSGKPCQGVGAGNAVVIVDETVDLADAADMVMRSKTFDHATSCSTENSLAVADSIYDKFLEELDKAGGYMCSAEEKAKLQKALWPDGKVLNREIVAQEAGKIADIAGIDLPEGKSFFLVEESGVGAEYPFSGEKLSVVAAVYRWKEYDEAVDLVNRITTYSGAGHSCGIHSTDEGRIAKLAENVRVSRIMVRQPQCLANSGAWTNGMPMTMSLGCGTWGGNTSSSNITWRELLNYTWVSYPIPSTEPSDEELFGKEIMEEK